MDEDNSIQNVFSEGIKYSQRNESFLEISMTRWVNEYTKNTENMNHSNKGGYQSPPTNGKNIKNNSLLTQWYNIVIQQSEDYLNEAVVHFDNIDIHSMWVNKNNRGDYNIEHNHVNGTEIILSGIYYLKTPDNCGDIVFMRSDPMAAIVWRKETIGEWSPYTASIHTMPAIANRFYLFPPWMKHRVEPNQSDEERISIAFNIMRD